MSTTAPGPGAGFDPFADGSTLLLSMESQLVSLYAERDQLQRELGVSDAADIIALVRDLRDEIAGLRSRLAEAEATPAMTPPALPAAAVPAPPPAAPTAGAPAASDDELEAWRTLGGTPAELRRRLEGHERQIASVVTLVDNLNSLLQSVPFEPVDLSGCDETVVDPVRKLEKRVGSVINLVDSVNDLLKERR